MSFANRVQAALDARGMTRADLCRETGLKSAHLVPYYRDPERSPNMATAIKIAAALGVSLDYLAELTDDMEPRRSTGVTREEARLLAAFRALGARDRESCVSMTEGLAARAASGAPSASSSRDRSA